MIGQSSPLSPVVKFADQLAALREQVAELRRLASTKPTIVGGVTSITTDATGIATVTHGLPFTPDGVVGTPESTNHTMLRIDNVGSSTFRVRAWDAAGSTVNSTEIIFQWVAFQEAST